MTAQFHAAYAGCNPLGKTYRFHNEHLLEWCVWY